MAEFQRELIRDRVRRDYDSPGHKENDWVDRRRISTRKRLLPFGARDSAGARLPSG
jgi:hypothetical protein